jgi:hypothetical protein
MNGMATSSMLNFFFLAPVWVSVVAFSAGDWVGFGGVF